MKYRSCLRFKNSITFKDAVSLRLNYHTWAFSKLGHFLLNFSWEMGITFTSQSEKNKCKYRLVNVDGWQDFCFIIICALESY